MEKVNRTVVTFKPEADMRSGKGLRLYIRNGEVQNPEVDALIQAGIQGELGLTAVRVRVTGQPTRILVRDVVEEDPATNL